MPRGKKEKKKKDCKRRQEDERKDQNRAGDGYPVGHNPEHDLAVIFRSGELQDLKRILNRTDLSVDLIGSGSEFLSPVVPDRRDSSAGCCGSRKVRCCQEVAEGRAQHRRMRGGEKEEFGGSQGWYWQKPVFPSEGRGNAN
uniref:(California timema) hypothetical protein n=1 Tax=Timema californicum TaxID=61474 RepID=A0A7R9PA03_TIMCA|nr:unnamed protein product [Timema californicum]